jgi:alanine dehydrogenase
MSVRTAAGPPSARRVSCRDCLPRREHISSRTEGPRGPSCMLGKKRAGRNRLRPRPLYLTEEDVEAVFTITDALEAVEGSFRRQAAGVIENRPRERLRLDGGRLAVMSASDLGLGVAGVKTYAAGPDEAKFVVTLFDASRHDVLAILEADTLGRLRTGAASGVAAKHLAKEGATSLGVIGCGRQAETQIAAVRAALPEIATTVVYSRDPKRRTSFARRMGAEPAESHQEAAAQDVVVTITTSKDPVLRGEWLRPGALVCAAGANVASNRELDNAVLERAAFVCCDSLEDAKLESGDLIEPVARGVLDWLEVHELAEVVADEVPGRQSEDDIVLFKSNGIAAWDIAAGAAAVAIARERGIGREL